MKTIREDLIALGRSGGFDGIVDSCTCVFTKGAGIAKFHPEAFPQVHAADLATSKGTCSTLGTLSSPRLNSPRQVVNGRTKHH